MKEDVNDKWPLIANTEIISYLDKAFRQGSPDGSYVFSGPDNLGKTRVAIFFAQLLLCLSPKEKSGQMLPCGICNSCRKFQKRKQDDLLISQSDLSEIHGDFHVLKKSREKKNISVEQVRDFIHILSLSSFGDGYRIGIIKQAEALSNEAANALLKTLEEPSPKTLIILVVKDPDSLPATIISRSQHLRFRTASAELIYEHLLKNYSQSREKARDLSRLSLGRPALAFKFLEDQEFYDFYTGNAEKILDIMDADINGRFHIIENLIDKKLIGQEAVLIAHRIIEIWQGLVRDKMLLGLGHKNLIQHIYLRDKLEKKGRVDPASLLALAKSLRNAHSLLDSNVNYRLVFESVALNI
jgi:DNA polymerase-3 subunit delta'